jgi:hypothetical protein
MASIQIEVPFPSLGGALSTNAIADLAYSTYSHGWAHSITSSVAKNARSQAPKLKTDDS